MRIIKHSWKWARPLQRRRGNPAWVNWHHAAANRLSPSRLHSLHLSLGWSGFAYNFYIEKSGEIHQGRPLEFCGGGALGDWCSVGVCLEGNYQYEKKMPAKQLRAAQELHDDLQRRWPAIRDRGHSAVPGNSTACPGKHYPLRAITAGVPKVTTKSPKSIPLTDRNITVPRQYKPMRAGWWNLSLVPYIEQVRAQGDGDRVTAGTADPLIIPVPIKWPNDLGSKVYAWKKKVREEGQAKAEETEVEEDGLPPSFWEHFKSLFRLWEKSQG